MYHTTCSPSQVCNSDATVAAPSPPLAPPPSLAASWAATFPQLLNPTSADYALVAPALPAAVAAAPTPTTSAAPVPTPTALASVSSSLPADEVLPIAPATGMTKCVANIAGYVLTHSVHNHVVLLLFPCAAQSQWRLRYPHLPAVCASITTRRPCLPVTLPGSGVRSANTPHQ